MDALIARKEQSHVNTDMYLLNDRIIRTTDRISISNDLGRNKGCFIPGISSSDAGGASDRRPHLHRSAGAGNNRDHFANGLLGTGLVAHNDPLGTGLVAHYEPTTPSPRAHFSPVDFLT